MQFFSNQSTSWNIERCAEVWGIRISRLWPLRGLTKGHRLGKVRIFTSNFSLRRADIPSSYPVFSLGIIFRILIRPSQAPHAGHACPRGSWLPPIAEVLPWGCAQKGVQGALRSSEHRDGGELTIPYLAFWECKLKYVYTSHRLRPHPPIF